MQGILSSIQSVFNTITVVDVLDILIMSYLIYQVIRFTRRTRAAQLIKGIIMLIIIYLLASQIGFKTVNFVLDKVLQYGIIALLFVFQPEMRRALEKLGRGRFSAFSIFSSKSITDEDRARWIAAINDICTAAESMSAEKTGALMAVERQTGLEEIISTGTVVNAAISPELIETIFFEGCPLHDGAVIIRDARLYAAGTYLPLSANPEINRDLGTRHRAAVGLSENSDAMVIVVSEETGVISVAKNGVIVRKLDRQGLQRMLMSEVLPEHTAKSSIFTRVFKNEEK